MFHPNPRPRCTLCFWAFWTPWFFVLVSFHFIWVVVLSNSSCIGMLSLCSRFLEIVLLLLVRKSVLIRSSLSTHCWEVVDIALLLVVVFLSIMSSISKVTIVWRSLSFKSLFQKHGLILHILRSTMFQSFWYAYC